MPTEILQPDLPSDGAVALVDAPDDAVAVEIPNASRAPHSRVLHIINGESYAGAERVQDLLALCLPEFGYDVEFACLKDGKFAQARRSQSTPLVTTPMRSRFDLRAARALARRVRAGNVDIIHTHTPRSAMIGRIVSALTGVPLVHHIHSPTVRDSTHRVSNWVNALVERLSIAKAPGVISVSQAMQRYTEEHRLSGQHMAVVPNGVSRTGPLAERPTPQGVWTIGTIALFRPRKGLDVLIEAIARLRQQGYAVRLCAVGTFESPDYETQTKQLVDKLGVADAVEWRGFRSDVIAELKGMDLFVLPSLFGEGLPMVILESMSTGVPVVATDVEGIPEAIRDGQEGVIVAAGDAGALARGIGRVVDGDVDWQTLRRNAYERQQEFYTDVAMARGVANVYDTVLKNQTKRPAKHR